MQQWLDIHSTEAGRMRERCWFVGLALIAVACGGEAEHNAPVAAGAVSGSGGAAGVVGTMGGSGAEASVTVTEWATNFETTQAQQGIGLWMGLGDPLPVGTPPVPHDGSALHLVGDSGMGLDVFFHTGIPIERIAGEVRFSAYAEKINSFTVGIAGPEPSYFSDHAAGIPWPETTFEVGSKWKTCSFPLEDLSVTPPHEEPFGAVHFVVQPGVHYDFWIDDFTLVGHSG
jgi:hypothetical protein